MICLERIVEFCRWLRRERGIFTIPRDPIELKNLAIDFTMARVGKPVGKSQPEPDTAHDFRECRKKPVVMEFREVQPDETTVETLEGFKPCLPDQHFIMRGVRGELYPIEKSIFYETYDILEVEHE